ncbi:hypothetical protein [Sulfurimonas marina]|uniref:Uncharacterized protein n=1 Tax=Sulfurimonas marina TaxID=2590551 RepID=A0A7M1AV41_9BACT|nr:hypothetical protein [Sulfurimonas marina]QOP41299.1 hypothetical protein FJR03_05900 [Sulfurimonas marina]
MFKKILLSVSIIFFCTSCSSPHINYNNHTIKLINKEKAIVKIPGQSIYKGILKLSNIKIGRNIYLADSGDILTVEELKAAPGYKFDGNIQNIVRIGFNNYKYHKKYTKGNISIFALEENNSDGAIVYLIIENINRKRIKLVYGATKDIFEESVKALKDEKFIYSVKAYNKSKMSVSDINVKQYIKTTWSEKDIILNGLIYKDGGYFQKPIK